MAFSWRLGGFPAVALALILSSCALGLDFEALDRTCEDPRFDLPTTAEYCAGELLEGATYLPPDLALPDSLTLYPLVATSGDVIATAALSLVEDAQGCVVATPGIDVGRIDQDGQIRHLGGLNGANAGLVFRFDNAVAGCSGNVAWVWPLELEILATTPQIHVLATFADAGLLELWLDPTSGELQFLHHLGGDPRAPTRRECLLGACVTAETQFCLRDAECAPATYCADDLTCTALDSCTLDAQCREDRQECATRRGQCALRCATDVDCPHPYTCLDGLCGGEGCSLDLVCAASSTTCVENACLRTCRDTAGCGGVTSCFEAGDFASICATGGRVGTCRTSDDCALGTAWGFAEVPPNGLTLSQKAILVGTDNNLRIGLFLPNYVSPYFVPAAPETELAGDTYVDLLHVSEYGAVYVALASGILVRFEWDGLTLGSATNTDEYTRTYPLDLAPGNELRAIRRVGDYLVTLEAPRADLGEAVPMFARVLGLNANPDEDLTPAFDGTLSLGDALQVSVGLLPDHDDFWVFGVARADRGELLFFDFRDIAEPQAMGSLRVGTREGEPSFPSVTADGLFATDSAGVRRYTLSLGETP